MNLERQNKGKETHWLFEAGVILKGLNALAEIVGGFLILFITKSSLVSVVFFAAQGELNEDPKDFIVNYLINSAQHFSISAQYFVAIYFLIHGLIKGFLVIGLLKKKLWAYPVSIIVFSLFIVYQLYRYTSTHSVWLILLTIFDLIVLWLIWREYKYITLKLNKPTSRYVET